MNNNLQRNLLGERIAATWRDLIEQIAAASAAGFAYDEVISTRADHSDPWGIPAIYKRGHLHDDCCLAA